MLTLGTVAFGSEFALGKDPLEHPSWFHLVAGYLVFIVALLGMTGVGALLNRIGRDSKNILPRQKNDGGAVSMSGGDSPDVS